MFIFVNVTVVLKYSHRGKKQKKNNVSYLNAVRF